MSERSSRSDAQRSAGITGGRCAAALSQIVKAEGLGDGDRAPDAVIQGNRVLLRAERSGQGNGRVYRIAFQADDGIGGVCPGSVTVCVPHDKSPGANCIDDGQIYNSLGTP